MKIYRVGGSVRDELLGLPVVDRDWLVVGATPQEMLARGFKAVGRDFPVFLHPDTHEEYALARTERKSGRGHQGFQFHADPSVTVEEDLARRDLTINAMARDESGALVDPYHGVADLEARTLRHVSPAFAEDPLRVLRVARFAARFGFDVAAGTEALMRQIVVSGELAELSPERVWREFALGLMAPMPSRMLAVLRRCGALVAVAPEIDAMFTEKEAGAETGAGAGAQPDAGVEMAAALDRGSNAPRRSLAIQFGIVGRRLTVDAIQSLSARIRAANDCRDAALTTARYAETLERAAGLDANQWLALLTGIDALRRPERIDVLLGVLGAYSALPTPKGEDRDDERLAGRVRAAAAALASIDYSGVSRDQSNVAERVRAMRIEALQTWLGDEPR